MTCTAWNTHTPVLGFISDLLPESVPHPELVALIIGCFIYCGLVVVAVSFMGRPKEES